MLELLNILIISVILKNSFMLLLFLVVVMFSVLGMYDFIMVILIKLRNVGVFYLEFLVGFLSFF